MAILSGLGRLGGDPKMQYTDNGTAKTFMKLAFTSGFGDKKKTMWLSATAWGTMAEHLNKFLQKGSFINFVGEVTELKTYERANGEVVPDLYIKLLTVDFISGTAKQENQQTTPFDGEEPEDF